MNGLPTVEQINEKYNYLQDARVTHIAASKLVADRKFELDTARNAALRNGIEGKNEAERGAQLAEICREWITAHSAAEEKEREARFSLDYAHCEVERLRLIMRLAEVTAVLGK